MSNFNPLVSCIVPVYNAEKYLAQGIDSLLNQTYTNLEIILVDDKSTDKSWEICLKYSKSFSNIKIYKHSKNTGGPLRGRETGIKKARGEWITFMDCDDYVKPTYIENLILATNNGEYDIAVTGHARFHENGKIENFLWKDYTQTTKQRLKTFYKHYFIDKDFWTDPTDTVGQNLVRAIVAKKTDLSIYPNNVWAEDTLMALAFLSNSKNGVNFIDKHDFIWRQRQGSGSHGGFSSTANRQAFHKAVLNIFNLNNLLPLVSIIIPIYNVQKHLKDCLDSVINQTYPNLEIILVDDKSTDGSLAIADNYAKQDKRIKLVCKTRNEGQNMARASGFSESTANYVMFVDSDDIIAKDCIETSLSLLIKNKADFVRFGMLTFKNNIMLKEKQLIKNSEEVIILTGKKKLFMTQFNQEVVLQNMPMFCMTVWGAVYKRDLVDKINWYDTNYRAYEDNIWTLRLLENTNKGVYTNKIGYYYRYDKKITGANSKTIVGNHINNKSVSFLGYVDILNNEYLKYNTKYNLKSDNYIESYINSIYIDRIMRLTVTDGWGIENNAKFLPKAAKLYQKLIDENEQIIKKHQENESKLVLDNNQLHALINKLNKENTSYLGIKRSTRLTLGNIKRKIFKTNKN